MVLGEFPLASCPTAALTAGSEVEGAATNCCSDFGLICCWIKNKQ